MIKISKFFTISLCLIGLNAFAQTPTTWGVGLRLGDPLGLSAKKYLGGERARRRKSSAEKELGGERAIEFNLGSSNNYGYDYRDAFYDYNRFEDYDYVNHVGHSSVSLQAHYLFQKDLYDVPGLQWYWGFGPQVRFSSYEFRYRYRMGNEWRYEVDRVTDFDLGGDVVIGLEYHIPDVPLSVFFDINVFLELVDDPFRFGGQEGIGIRYNIQ